MKLGNQILTICLEFEERFARTLSFSSFLYLGWMEMFELVGELAVENVWK